jgi:hypothetical protein
LAKLEEATDHALSSASGHLWSFSTRCGQDRAARILVWLRAALREIHEYYGRIESAAIKSVADMIEDIFAGRPAQEAALKRVAVGLDLLQPAYDDFMQSRPELSEGERRDLFVRVIRLQTCRLRLH